MPSFLANGVPEQPDAMRRSYDGAQREGEGPRASPAGAASQQRSRASTVVLDAGILHAVIMVHSSEDSPHLLQFFRIHLPQVQNVFSRLRPDRQDSFGLGICNREYMIRFAKVMPLEGCADTPFFRGKKSFIFWGAKKRETPDCRRISTPLNGKGHDQVVSEFSSNKRHGFHGVARLKCKVKGAPRAGRPV